MLVTAGLATFRAISAIQDRARPELNRGQSARVLLDRLEDELSGTTLVVKEPFSSRLKHPWVFIGEDRVFGTNDSDAIRFITNNPARPPGARSMAGLRMVTYAVGSLGEDHRLTLYRSERRLPDGMRKRIDLRAATPVIHDLVFLRFRYLAEDGWRERWDSTDVAQLDQLPRTVEIELQLWEQRPDGSEAPGRIHARSVALPARPIQPAGGDAEAGCGDGPTLRSCLLRLRGKLRELPTGQRVKVYRLVRTAPDLCWDADDTTPALAEFKVALEDALPGVADELCR